MGVRAATINAAAARVAGSTGAGKAAPGANPYGSGTYGGGTYGAVDRLFREHVDVYTRVAYSKRAVTTALVKMALKVRPAAERDGV